ncbi:MAG TPA: response regulator [Candidatus Angelobacter sp.]|nr:response regulator [Candidatus Angelobacter sp.]
MTKSNGIILLVDDEPWLSEALAATLESKGFSCVFATDMTAGIKALEENSVAALVTDIMMPPGSQFPHVNANEVGFHFIDYVQKHWRGLPIVCLSVIGDHAKIHLLTRKGIRYLRKGETPLSTAVEVITAVALGRKVRI